MSSVSSVVKSSFRHVSLVPCCVVGPAAAQDSAPLRVRTEVEPGPYYVGEGFELTVGVNARDQRPELELPAIRHGEIWTIGTAFKPLSATGIGRVVSGENLFVTRLRVVPRRPGPLEIPPITARLGGRSGRSRQLRLDVMGVPPEGRPAAFLGGVGDFSVEADVSPATVRVGQELTYRITVTGPAAWGMTARPDLSRLDGSRSLPGSRLSPTRPSTSPPREPSSPASAPPAPATPSSLPS